MSSRLVKEDCKMRPVPFVAAAGLLALAACNDSRMAGDDPYHDAQEAKKSEAASGYSTPDPHLIPPAGTAPSAGNPDASTARPTPPGD
jgi:hypothetical protein